MQLFVVFAISYLGWSYADTIPQRSFNCPTIPYFDIELCCFQNTDETENCLLVDATTRHSYALDGPLKGISNSGKFLQLANSTSQLVSSSVDLHGYYCFSLDNYVTG